MELTVTHKRDNPVLGRTEVQFTIVHAGAGTPSRSDIRKAVAGAVGGKEGVVILDWARSDYGRTATRGYAKVYKTKERAMELETFPVLVRNGLKQAVAKAAAPAEGAPAPHGPAKREAPKEAPKKEAAPPKEEKKGAPTPAKEEKKAPGPREDKKAAPPKDERKPAAKDDKKPAKKEGK